MEQVIIPSLGSIKYNSFSLTPVVNTLSVVTVLTTTVIKSTLLPVTLGLAPQPAPSPGLQ